MDVLYRNIGLLATPTGTRALGGHACQEITRIPNAAVGVKNGRIVYVGPDKPSLPAQRHVDCKQRLVTPGLVDCHTHLIFGAWRQSEFSEKLAGKSYLDILRQGGGIYSTVDKTRSASQEQLVELGRLHLEEMFCNGTTTCECKSGYGLDFDTEIKQLQAVARLEETQNVQLVATYMGAHALPQEWQGKRRAYISQMINEILPYIAQNKLAEFCDVFCDEGVFTPEETFTLLQKAGHLGLGRKAHVDKLAAIGGAAAAAKAKCLTAEHLIYSDEQAIAQMAKAGLIAVLLPSTSFYLNTQYADAQEMIRQRMPVALGTDFNPGSSPGLNMQFTMQLACIKLRMTPAQALIGATLNAAAAINRAHCIGTLEVGKQADLLIWDSPDLDYIFYRFGTNLVRGTVKKGIYYNWEE